MLYESTSRHFFIASGGGEAAEGAEAAAASAKATSGGSAGGKATAGDQAGWHGAMANPWLVAMVGPLVLFYWWSMGHRRP